MDGHRVTIASDTEIDNSCSLMLNGQYYIFGGYMKNKQVRLRSNDSIPRIQFDFQDCQCMKIHHNLHLKIARHKNTFLALLRRVSLTLLMHD